MTRVSAKSLRRRSGPPGLHMQSPAFIIVLDALSREFQLHDDNLIIIVDWLEDLDIERSHRGERAEDKCRKIKGLRCVYCIYCNYWMYIWRCCFPVMIYCISKEGTMRAKLILCFYNSRLYGEDLTSKIILSPFSHPMAPAAVRSKTKVLLLLIHCGCCFSHCLWWFSVRSLSCFAVLCALPSFAIIWLGKRELVALHLLFSDCLVAVIVLRLFLAVPWIGR